MMEMVEKIANRKCDGHFTLMKFSTGWKGMYGTPDLNGLDTRQLIKQLPIFDSLYECLKSLVVNGLNCDKMSKMPLSVTFGQNFASMISVT